MECVDMRSLRMLSVMNVIFLQNGLEDSITRAEEKINKLVYIILVNNPRTAFNPYICQGLI